MKPETVEALRRIEAQLARLSALEGWIRERRSLIEVNEFCFLLARCERAKESVGSLYNLLLMEHRIFAKSRECLVGIDQVQLSLF